MMPPLLIFVFILSLLIFIHEAGHFFAARNFGIDVEEFGIGIPPRAWSKKVGKTIYSLNWLPLGGFVKIKGEDFEDYDPKDRTNFINKKPWQKSTVLLAGILMNILLGVTLFYFVLGINGWESNPILLLNDYDFKFGESIKLPNVVTFIFDGSPADKVNIEFADRIIQIDYVEGDLREAITPSTVEEVREFLKDKGGREVIVSTENINTGKHSTYVIIPEYSEEVEGPALGVGLGDAVQLSYGSTLNKFGAGFLHSANILGYSVFALKNMAKQAIFEKDISAVSHGVAGPVGIFGAVKAILEVGGDKVVTTILDLTALLSLSLGIMNLLPIPALDGGRMVFVLAEWVTGKRPSPKLEARAHRIGFVFLVVLLLVITLKDIVQFKKDYPF